MTKINFRSCLPYAIALIIFILIAYIYASPVLEGKIINQADISSYQGAAKERDDYKKQTGEESFWTNSMFSGMPTTMIGAHYKGNYLETIYNHLFWGPRPASYLDFCQFLFAVACDGNQCPALYCRSFGLRFMCL